MKKNKKINAVIYHIFTIVVGILLIYPLLWMVASSFKETSMIFHTSESLIPKPFVTHNYFNGWKGFGGYSFGLFFGNSLLVAGISTAGAVFCSALVAYGFARLEFPLKRIWFSCMMMTMMLPFQVIMVPQFIMFKQMNLVGTRLPLIAPYFFGQAFFIFLIMQFIQGIPRDLDEAARIDGCSTYGIFFRIILPLVKPACISSAIFSFMWRWDDFLGPLLYLNEPSKYTVSIALKMFSDPSASSDYGAMFAMSTLSVLPTFLIFVLFQKYIVEGQISAGVKG